MFHLTVGAQHMMISCRQASVFHSQSRYPRWLIFWSTYGMKKGSMISCDFGFPLALLLENVVTFLPTKDVFT
uniref:Uncharacterized protein n=1 Tax=Arundo donax TaxID=35708 RepID=A0A0A9CUP2_ARUDO